LLGPTAISLIAAAFPSRQRKALEELAKAGEIKQRVAEATTMEQKVKTLEAERRQLTTIIQYETRRQVIQEREEVLRGEVQRLDELAGQLLAELEAIEKESRFLSQEIDNSSLRNEVIAIRKRLERGRTGAVRPYFKWLDLALGAALPPLSSSSIFSQSANTTLDQVENFRIKRLARRAARTREADHPGPADDPTQADDQDGSEPAEHTE
jgi:hypothetical protein